MADTQTERPRYYQGQYLGPEDLAAAVDHARWARARHDLGAHAWGIHIGLQLREETALDGGVDVFVEPGYATDGFGRPLVVTSALEVPRESLRQLSLSPPAGSTSLRVPVWLRYAEETAGDPPYGFALCEGDDQRERTVETVQVLVGGRAMSEQREGIDLAGTDTDAVRALQRGDVTGPLLCDGSVPFQTFPTDSERVWLIPLGFVRWEPAPPGRLLNTTADDHRETRRFRRYLSVIAEGVLAADGVVRIRSRTRNPQPGGASTADPCFEEWPRVSGDLDMMHDNATGRVSFPELVWIEGNLRLVGDGRLFGGRLEWRDAAGDDHAVPMWMQRMEANDFVGAGGAASGRDLQILIGATDNPDGRNRLVIGATPAQPDDVAGRVVIQNDGRVGIGTFDPSTHLPAPLTIRAIGAGEELLYFEAPDGTKRWHMNQNLGGSANGLNFVETGIADGRLFLKAGGNVGIGTTNPAAKLDIQSVSNAPGNRWLRVGNGGDSGRVWIEYVDAAPLLVLSDMDDPPRIRFQQIGNGDEDNPDHASWFGQATNSSPNMALMNANLGLGTLNPIGRLSIRGILEPQQGLLTFFSQTADVEYDGGSDGVFLLRDTGGTTAFIGGNIGVGTTGPTEKLDVRGNIKLGAAGEFFGVGARENFRVIAGRVQQAFGTVNGTGWSATWTGAGVCGVTFHPAFNGIPVVVATPMTNDIDQHVVVAHLIGGGFTAFTSDVQDSADPNYGIPESTPFTFIAFGTFA